MLYTEKNTVEAFIIQEAQRLGWRYIVPEDLNRERKDLEEPLFIEDLKRALKKN